MLKVSILENFGIDKYTPMCYNGTMGRFDKPLAMEPPLRKRGRKAGAYGPYRHESHGGKVVLKLRDSHHRIAMLFASGLRTAEVAAETGYSLSYVSNLRGDPSMCDLIAFYHDQNVEPEYIKRITSFQGKLARLREIATDQLIEHAEEAAESGEKLRVRELLSMVAESADRTGHGKHQVHEVHHTFAAQLDKALAASAKVIELRAAPSPLLVEDGNREATTVEVLPVPAPQGSDQRSRESVTVQATVGVGAGRMRR